MTMVRASLFAAVLPAFALIGATPSAGGIPVNYGTAELGQVKTACLTACFGTNCAGSGTINNITVAAPFFVRGIRVGPNSAGDNLCNNTPEVTRPVKLPRTINTGQRLVWDVDLLPTQLGDFDRPLTVNNQAAFELMAFVAPVTSCTPSSVATCLADDRFKVRVNWRTDLGTRDSGQVVPFGSDDSGLFYFFNPNNWEMLLKVLNGCPVNNRFWVFSAATTNVEFTLTVTDTQDQRVKTYFNPLGKPAAPIQDTSAFATCP
jgi:hypothetical protein